MENKLTKKKPYIHVLVGDNNKDIHIYSPNDTEINHKKLELEEKIKELELTLMWAKNQLVIKDLIISQLMNM